MTANMKIDSLTPEQEAMLPVYRDRWIGIGLSTEPMNFEKAKAALIEAYKVAELSPPKTILTAKSPIDAIKVGQAHFPELSASDIFNSSIYGSHDAAWLSFYAFFKDEVKLECCNKAGPLIELAHHCGWVNVFDEMAIIQDRPEVIKMDDRNLLHCQDGPAIRYRDGFSVYSWHGTRIPDEWISNPESLTPTAALTWDNVEQRRCACEILGWAKILRQLDAKTVDSDADPEIGTLVEVVLPDIGKEKFLIVLCGTKREFALPVPPEMKTAAEANAWTFGFDLSEFIKPEVRT